MGSCYPPTPGSLKVGPNFIAPADEPSTNNLLRAYCGLALGLEWVHSAGERLGNISKSKQLENSMLRAVKSAQSALGTVRTEEVLTSIY